MPATAPTDLGPVSSRLASAIRDYVQALNSPNGHPFAAGEELERQIKGFGAEVLRLARGTEAVAPEHSTPSE